MEKKKEILVMTSFGPVPYEAIKNWLPKKVTETIERNKEKLFKTRETSPEDLEYYLNKIANRQGWDSNKMKHFMSKMFDINYAAAFSVYLREIAIELDKKYEDHISNCNEVYVISIADGRIHKMYKAQIKNFKNFAAFRTVEDAQFACKILKHMIKYMC